MKTSILKLGQFTISIIDGQTNNGDIDGQTNNGEKLIEGCDQFEIKEAGIYTLEGDNRTGKSVLIKTILGVHPPEVKSGMITTFIAGESVHISNVREAFKNGIVAVFQDDELIPTMTLKQQLRLRHGTLRLKNYFFLIWNYLLKFFLLRWSGPEKIVGMINEQWGHVLENVINRISPNSSQIDPTTPYIKKCEELLLSYGIEEDILDKYPNQLSGGTKAIFKIVNAQLTPDIKVLFLDEALNAVAENKWGIIIDKLKEWAKESESSIVVVSHNKKEIYRWQPKIRFRIEEKEIKVYGRNDYDGLEVGVKTQNDFFIRYDSLAKAMGYIKDEITTPIYVLYDSCLRSSKNETFTGFENMLSGRQVHFYELTCCEEYKNMDTYCKIIENISEMLKNNKGTIILIGGGFVINLGLFVAGTLYRGIIKLIIIPTTVMAIADIAIGSKASLNYKNHKHLIGCYKNPDCIIQDKGFLSTLSSPQILIGLAESFKHGLLQSENLFNQCKEVFSLKQYGLEKIYKIALLTQKLKSDTLLGDNFEMFHANLLLYGHLHAHALERFHNFEIEHGTAVYIGILLDLLLSGGDKLVQSLIQVFKGSDLENNINKLIIVDYDFEELKKIYDSDPKSQHIANSEKVYRSISVEKLEQYAKMESKLKFVEYRMFDIEKAYKKLRFFWEIENHN